MAFGNNAKLVKDATLVTVAPNNTNDVVANTPGSTAFSFSGNAGDDTIENFGKNDAILNYKAIFDGNGDNIISLGQPQQILDIDRISKTNKGVNQINVQGLTSNELRYLGNKDGYFAYADASVRLAGLTEGTVGNDAFDASGGAKKYFYDTALGLNLGGDTIKNFGSDDEIVTTSAIFNGKDGQLNGIQITYGKNKVLDLSGSTMSTKGDDGANHGGQIDLVGTSGIYFHYSETISGVTYYHYGLDPISA